MNKKQNRNPDFEINVSNEITWIIEESVKKNSSFRHIDIQKLLVCIASNRSKSRGGIYGKLIPLKFKDGKETLKYRGRYYAMPQIIHNETPLLYLIYFYVPMFFDLAPREKLKVIFHELYHINPDFNGDIRRMGMGKPAHGHSKKKFDSFFEDELDSFYDIISGTKYMEFLKMDTRTIFKRYSNVLCRRMKLPRPVPIDN